MYILEESKYLYLLLLIPFLVVLFLWNWFWKKRKQKEFGDAELLKKLIPDYSPTKSVLKFVVFVISLALIIYALCNPRFGSKMETVQLEGIDVVFAVDVSKSMLANDVAPNRIEKSKQIVNQTINKLNGDRIGIVAYAASAYPILPITSDYSMGKMQIQNMNTNMLSSQGTAINDAINLALTFFDKKKKSKLIVLLSDGEDHGNDMDDAINEAKEKGVKIVTIGLGTEEGSTIPFLENGVVVGYKKDIDGEIVVSKLNADILKEIASDTDGKYINGNNSSTAIKSLLSAINAIEKNKSESQQISEYKSQFQWFIGIAFLLLLLDMFFLERKTAWFNKLNLFKEKNHE